jgi:hypothetical protein
MEGDWREERNFGASPDAEREAGGGTGREGGEKKRGKNVPSSNHMEDWRARREDDQEEWSGGREEEGKNIPSNDHCKAVVSPIFFGSVEDWRAEEAVEGQEERREEEARSNHGS